MCEYAEMFALKYKGVIEGYRIYVRVNGVDEYYDIQTRSLDYSSYISGVLKLKRVGNILATDDEITKEIKPKQLTAHDKDSIKRLLGLVQHYYRLRQESRDSYQ